MSDSDTSSTRGISRKTLLHGLLAFGGLAAMFYLLIAQAALGPLLVAVVGFVLVWPLRAVPAARPIVMALWIVIGAFLLSRLGGVLAPFAAVFVLAYLLDPVVTWAKTKWGPSALGVHLRADARCRGRCGRGRRLPRALAASPARDLRRERRRADAPAPGLGGALDVPGWHRVIGAD